MEAFLPSTSIGVGELGIIATAGIANVKPLATIVRDESDPRLPPAARFALEEIVGQIDRLAVRIEKLEREIIAVAKQDEDMRRLATIPGVGAITAMAIKAFIPDPAGFKSARHFAVWDSHRNRIQAGASSVSATSRK